MREVMRTETGACFPPSNSRGTAQNAGRASRAQRGQHLYPVVDSRKSVKGVITRKHLQALIEKSEPEAVTLESVAQRPIVAYADEPLRLIVLRMAESGFTRLPVLESGSLKLMGMISLNDLLKARAHNLTEERHRERVLRVRIPLGGANAEAVLPSSTIERL